MKLPVNYEKTSIHERRLVREEYIRIQDGKCHYCNQSLSGGPNKSVTRKKIDRKLFPKNFFKWPIHLHYCHKSGMTIGAVHNYCNAVLWQYFGE
jgi:hypothetical protein